MGREVTDIRLVFILLLSSFILTSHFTRLRRIVLSNSSLFSFLHRVFLLFQNETD